MCPPLVPGKDFARVHKVPSLKVLAMAGSIGVKPLQEVKLAAGMVGLADEDQRDCPPGFYILLFEQQKSSVVRAAVPKSVLKGHEHSALL